MNDEDDARMLESTLRERWTATVSDEAVWETGNPTLTYKPVRPRKEEARDAPRATVSRASALSGGRDYQLVERIGEGGMGLVWRARQVSLQRDVALKQVRTDLGQGGSTGYRERFLAEALVTGYLEHPNIVPVHSLVELETGEPAITMKLVQGIGWDRLLHPKTEEQRARARETDLEEHLRILLAVCDAVSFAHSRRILHCDVKPQNVMVGEYGEVMLMDWGLALHADDPGSGVVRTLQAARLRVPAGTPAYMAREQALADGAAIGPRTDVYQLGAVLHEILTGHPPHEGKGLREVLVSAAHAAPPQFGEDVPPPLGRIAGRAMAAAPSERYPSVREFQLALREYLKHQESLTISRKAMNRLAHVQEDAASGATEGHEQVYLQFEDIGSRFRQALELWDGNQEAARGVREVTLAFARTAIREGDLRLAQAQVNRLGAQDAEAAALAEEIEAGLRQARRRRLQMRLLRAVAVAFILLTLFVTAYGLFLVHWTRARAMEYRDLGWEGQDQLLRKIEAMQLEIQELRQSRSD